MFKGLFAHEGCSKITLVLNLLASYFVIQSYANMERMATEESRYYCSYSFQLNGKAIFATLLCFSWVWSLESGCVELPAAASSQALINMPFLLPRSENNYLFVSLLRRGGFL